MHVEQASHSGCHLEALLTLSSYRTSSPAPPWKPQNPRWMFCLKLGRFLAIFFRQAAIFWTYQVEVVPTSSQSCQCRENFVGINSTGRPAYRRQTSWTQNPHRAMNCYHVYAIRSCKRNYIYVGLTNNPQRRIEEHKRGKERTTRPYTPFRILLKEKSI